MAVTLFFILLFGHIGSLSHFPFNWQLLLNFESVTGFQLVFIGKWAVHI